MKSEGVVSQKSESVNSVAEMNVHLYGVVEKEEEAELWKEMAFALESSKVTVENSKGNDFNLKEECEHSFIYRDDDDTGEVCCLCGLIKKPIARMIEAEIAQTMARRIIKMELICSEEEEEAELWRQMALAQESFKVTVENSQDNDPKQIEDCEHSFIYKDDVGEVCCVCGLIKTPIASIIEVVYNKDDKLLL